MPDSVEQLQQRVAALRQQVIELEAKAEANALMVKTLQESGAKYRSLVESTSDWLWEVSLEGVYTYVSPQVETLLGFKPEEVLGKTPFDLMPEDEKERISGVFKDLVDRCEPITALENVNLHKDGRRIVLETSGVPLFSQSGQVLGYRGVDRDITERKQALEEKVLLERQVLQAQKLESLGVMAGGIAHDFNNLLMGILGNADLALSRLDPDSPTWENVYAIETATRRAADLAKQMLAYSGRGKFVVVSTDIQKLIEEMVHLLDISISKKVTLQYEFAPNLAPIDADVTQIRQIIMNLVINASESLGDDGGVISIRTGSFDCDHDGREGPYLGNDLTEGSYSYVEISDTGKGMDPEVIKRIFDPFFTTKFTGHGLGLAAVLGIVRGHHGAIKVTSEIGQGATFKVFFPCSEASKSVENAPRPEGRLTRFEGKTALLVDDEETVRTVGRRMLEHIGMDVVTADDGKQGLELFSEAPDKFDLVVMDLTMPVMDGEEAFQEMLLIRDDVRVILSSGYNEPDFIARFESKGLAGFIQKPYQMKTLIAAVAQAFNN
jgi:two-component system, cell cycle sensor histidine kinase and response regulator CckA